MNMDDRLSLSALRFNLEKLSNQLTIQQEQVNSAIKHIDEILERQHGAMEEEEEGTA
ncbi:hypothetical protein ABEX38_30025 [Priestia megaterium]